MEYAKIKILLDNTANQPSKFSTKNCLEINEDARRTFSIHMQTTFKIAINNNYYKYNNYNNYINITIIEVNSTKADNANNLDVVIAMYNLKECSNNYSITAEILWQNYKSEPDDTGINTSESFRSKVKLKRKTPDNRS